MFFLALPGLEQGSCRGLFDRVKLRLPFGRVSLCTPHLLLSWACVGDTSEPDECTRFVRFVLL